MNHIGLYSIASRTINRDPVIFLFKRDKNRVKQIDYIRNFKPYVYVSSKALKAKKYPGFTKIDSTVYNDIYGNLVQKCWLKSPFEMYSVKSFYSNPNDIMNPFRDVYEADVLFDLRYAIDEVDEVEKTNYKILTFDIETDCLEGFPSYENPVEPIICIAIHDNYSNETYSYTWRDDLSQGKIGDFINVYDNEFDMLNAFIKKWRDIDADIVTNWNLQFDMKYLIARLEKLGIDYQQLSTVLAPIDSYVAKNGHIYNQKVEKRNKDEIEVLGVVLFDLFRAYKKMHFGELASYSLNSVASIELGEAKDKVHNTGEMWRKDIKKLIDYNRKDVDLVIRIDKKVKLISIFDDIKRFAGVRDINDNFFASRIHETRIMKKYRGEKVFPTKPPFKEKSEETMITGAFVKSPKPGLYENVICLDAKSLYPSIIYTFNLSTEMINEREGQLINGVRIKQQPKGIMPSMIKELVDLKDRMKIEVEGTGQDVADKMFAIKTFINSFYGINALTSFRLYDKRIAQNITYLGQQITKTCSDLIEKEFPYKVIYNDTDSMFIHIGSTVKDEKEVVEIGRTIQNFINDMLPEIVNKLGGDSGHSTVHVEFEKMFERIIFQAKSSKEGGGTKKRYAGLIKWEDNKFIDKIKIVGMAARRSDTPEISKKVQKKMFEIILRGKDFSEVNVMLKDTMVNMYKRKINVEDIALPVKLNKAVEDYTRKVRKGGKETGEVVQQSGPKLKGVTWSNKILGTNFRSGTKFMMIYVIHPETKVICFEEADQLGDIQIDWKTMFDKCIYQKVKSIYLTLNKEVDFMNIVLYGRFMATGQRTLWN